MTRRLLLLALFTLPALAAPQPRVVIVVMDGLRPDSVTDADTPTLAALAKSGVFFRNHHPAYLSSTEVNGAALATGCVPARTRIVGNEEYRPEIELLKPVDTQDPFAVWQGDRTHDGQHVGVPTLPEILRGAGARAVVAGSKGVALLWNRAPKNRAAHEVTLFEGKAVPAAFLDELHEAQGPFPPVANPKQSANLAQDAWTTRALVDRLWADDKGGVPPLSVLWLSEPDFVQHGSGPGSAVARAALKGSDDNLKLVLDTLEKKGLRNSTNVMVVSDHGFSTIGETVDVAAELKKRGIKAAGSYAAKPGKGDVVVVGLGGTVNLYVTDRDAKVTADVVRALQESPFAGVIFTWAGGDGTFRLADVNLDAPDAPDVVVSLRWSDAEGAGGLKGTILSEGTKRAKGQGNHTSLSRSDMNNTLIAAGPAFRSGYDSPLPSANVDVAPTVLRVLGVTQSPPAKMDGRVLTEALAGAQPPAGALERTTLVARRDAGTLLPWRQYLKLTRFAGRTYYIEGNAGEGNE